MDLCLKPTLGEHGGDRFGLGFRQEAHARLELQPARALRLYAFARQRHLDRELAGLAEALVGRAQKAALDAHAAGRERLHAQHELVVRDLLAEDPDPPLALLAGAACDRQVGVLFDHGAALCGDRRGHSQRLRAEGAAVGGERRVRALRQVEHEARHGNVGDRAERRRGDAVLDLRVAVEDHAHAIAFQQQVEVGEGRAAV